MENNAELLNSENRDNEQPTDIHEIKELTPQESIEKAQYEYLKVLNKKLSMFKKQENKSEEQTEQTMRR